MNTVPGAIIDKIEDDGRPWDCVVIGAGVAGCVTACLVARAGLRTLLIERKEFPRYKVCGACLNQRSVERLKQAGLFAAIAADTSQPIDRCRLMHNQRQLVLRLPLGLAIRRSVLDAALAAATVAAGATFVTGTQATVQYDFAADCRTIQLTQPSAGRTDRSESSTVRARWVVVADGLSHPSVRHWPEFRDVISPAARIGVGRMIDPGAYRVPPGTIQMAVGRSGYVGMVGVDGRRTNLAAAVDRQCLRKHGSMHAAINEILLQAGAEPLADPVADPTSQSSFDPSIESQGRWQGTAPLTRRAQTVANRRVFLVGDAAAYVEPFTGEGMTWAIGGGASISSLVVRAQASNSYNPENAWRRQWQREFASHQKWCHRLSFLLRHPRAIQVAMTSCRWFPMLARSIIHSVAQKEHVVPSHNDPLEPTI